jgi:hypothetical protein
MAVVAPPIVIIRLTTPMAASYSALAVFTGSRGNENRQEAKGSDKPTLEGAKGS